MSHFKKLFLPFLMIIVCLNQTLSPIQAGFSYVALSKYHVTAQIGDELYITALTSTGKKPAWKSSNTKVATVNTYGKVTAKHSGTASITARIKDAEATCKVTVAKTELTLNQTNLSLENGESFSLTGTTSNRSPITWKSNKTSVATVSQDGVITAHKPGDAIISAKADDTIKTCTVKIKKPQIKLSMTSLTLYRKEQRKLTAAVSSNLSPAWKSSKRSVVSVNERGLITAIKHGSCIITAAIDGVTAKCYVTVKQPTVTLNHSRLEIPVGSCKVLKPQVSSGNSPQWSSSNTAVATVSNGTVTGHSKGKATIYAQEDGIKAKCSVTVTQ
ncbi:Ig-like domain-containing protein [[Clostridium] polysaccharolyticum]|uniref:Ig-like domain (Group 2) n=1 Tax=[Clostridium] polysaccharolyticum TaxID=29364 RepID=A0A1I0A881_9FIRM|nr:Ig-like domain-containing protein [[Clostridium] polysaccharolyticum]SES90356.1 Ig-like domain (group 2) [[Clostridium] polysaccharolyticum]